MLFTDTILKLAFNKEGHQLKKIGKSLGCKVEKGKRSAQFVVENFEIEKIERFFKVYYISCSLFLDCVCF